MILLYALFAGVVAGTLLRGSLARLADIKVRWAPMVLLAFGAQVVVFSDPVSRLVGDIGPAAYVVSTLAVFVVVLRNFRLPGLPLVAVGGVSNLVAILSNGGYMPASPAALLAAGRHVPETYTNSREALDPAFRVLTDIFAMPAWLPAANVFSVGDVLIGLGLIVVIVTGMRGTVVARGQLPRKDAAIGTPSS